MIYKNLVNSAVEAGSTEEVLVRGAKMLFNNGFVKKTYCEAILARERKFPTGLKLRNLSVAIPHTDSIYVNKPGICVMKLKKPATFSHMGDPSQRVDANLIFMMAILDPSEQIDTLKKVVDAFQNCTIIDEFKTADNDEDLYAVAKKYLD